MLERIDTTAAVETPERVRFRYRLAGPGRRAVAWGLDGLVKILLLVVTLILLSPLMLLPEVSGVGIGLFLVALFLLEWGYGVFFETLFSGRTPGKFALDLRVVREDGAPGRFADFLLRNLLRAADFLPFGFAVGVATMFLDRKLRRLGDLLAGTVVVVEGRGRLHGEVVLDPPVSDLERQGLPPRVDLTREEIEVIEEFLRRRRTFSEERAEELAGLLGPALSDRTGVVAPSWGRVLALAYARATGKDR